MDSLSLCRKTPSLQHLSRSQLQDPARPMILCYNLYLEERLASLAVDHPPLTERLRKRITHLCRSQAEAAIAQARLSGDSETPLMLARGAVGQLIDVHMSPGHCARQS